MLCLLVLYLFVIATGAVDCLKIFVSKMTCYVERDFETYFPLPPPHIVTNSFVTFQRCELDLWRTQTFKNK